MPRAGSIRPSFASGNAGVPISAPSPALCRRQTASRPSHANASIAPKAASWAPWPVGWIGANSTYRVSRTVCRGRLRAPGSPACCRTCPHLINAYGFASNAPVIAAYSNCRRASKRLVSVRLGLDRDLQRAGARHAQMTSALDRVWMASLKKRQGGLDALGKLLDTLGYPQVLSRGFALVRDGEGRPVRSSRGMHPAAFLDIEFADGHIDVMTAGAPQAKARTIENSIRATFAVLEPGRGTCRHVGCDDDQRHRFRGCAGLENVVSHQAGPRIRARK